MENGFFAENSGAIAAAGMDHETEEMDDDDVSSTGSSSFVNPDDEDNNIPSSSCSSAVHAAKLKTPISNKEFHQQRSAIISWFKRLNDDQKNVLLREQYPDFGPLQIHMLSSLLENRLHEYCPPNCLDPLASLPDLMAIRILSYLEPGYTKNPASLFKFSRIRVDDYFKLVGKLLHSKAKVVYGGLPQCKIYDHQKGEQAEKIVEVTSRRNSTRLDLAARASDPGKRPQIEQLRTRQETCKNLCRAMKVCRRWRKLSLESSLWKHLCRSKRLYRMSSTKAEQEHLIKFQTKDGHTKWREAFGERYRLWKNWMQARCVVRTFEGHAEGISCVQFDKERIASGSSDNLIKLWDMRTNSALASMTLTGHSATVRCLQLSYPVLVSGSNDHTIKVWDLSLNSAWSSINCRATMIGHSKAVRCLQNDCDKVISGSYDATLKSWDINTGTCNITLRGHDDAVLCLQYDSYKIISGSSDNSIKLWDIRSGSCSMTLNNAHSNAVTCLQFDDHRIVSGSLDHTIKFWDIRTGRWMQTLDCTGGDAEGHTGVVRCLQADQWRIVSGADDKTIQVWNLQTGRRISSLRSHSDGITCLRFDDTKIVSGSYDKTVKLWDFGIV